MEEPSALGGRETCLQEKSTTPSGRKREELLWALGRKLKIWLTVI